MEENKVREKIAKISADWLREWRFECNAAGNTDQLADLILQSPDLRVTIVEPRFCVAQDRGKPIVVRRDDGIDEEIATFRGHSVGKQLAQDYADWLNSKERKGSQ